MSIYYSELQKVIQKGNEKNETTSKALPSKFLDGL